MTVDRIRSLAPPLAAPAGPAAARRTHAPVAPAAPAPPASPEPELAGALTEAERAHFLAQAFAGPATYAPARRDADATAAPLGRHLDVRA